MCSSLKATAYFAMLLAVMHVHTQSDKSRVLQGMMTLGGALTQQAPRQQMALSQRPERWNA